MADENGKPEDKRGAPKGSFGNVPYQPTDADREKVERMAGLQISQVEIAMVMGIHVNTLANHYSAEFERGRAMMGIKLREHAYTQAFGKLKNPDKPEDGYVPEFRPDPKMTQFMLERQFGMVQQTRQEHVGDPEKPVEIRHIRRVVVDPKELKDGE